MRENNRASTGRLGMDRQIENMFLLSVSLAFCAVLSEKYVNKHTQAADRGIATEIATCLSLKGYLLNR